MFALVLQSPKSMKRSAMGKRSRHCLAQAVIWLLAACLPLVELPALACYCSVSSTGPTCCFAGQPSTDQSSADRHCCSAGQCLGLPGDVCPCGKSCRCHDGVQSAFLFGSPGLASQTERPSELSVIAEPLLPKVTWRLSRQHRNNRSTLPTPATSLQRCIVLSRFSL